MDTNFLPPSKIFGGGTKLATQFNSPSSLSGTAVFTSSGIAQITVKTSDPENSGNPFGTQALPAKVNVPNDKADLTVSDVAIGAITGSATRTTVFRTWTPATGPMEAILATVFCTVASVAGGSEGPTSGELIVESSESNNAVSAVLALR